MKLSLRLLLLLPFIFVMVGCPKDDEPVTEVLRNPQDVYNKDIADIEDFMDTHFITVDGDYNVTFTEITGSTPGSPISVHPDLTFKTITRAGVDHKLYFLKLREGIGNTDVDLIENDRPTKLDSVFASYKAHKMDLSTLDQLATPYWSVLNINATILAWDEIFPEFKRGNATFNSSTGNTSYSDFGAGVMFIPSGLGYYNKTQGLLTSYSPFILNFKLMNIKYRDHDGDKVLSKDEYLGTGLVSGTARDSDSDGKPDYADFDDDNDGKVTKEEIRITPGISSWYAFGSIPVCLPGGNGKPKHLDSSCQ